MIDPVQTPDDLRRFLDTPRLGTLIISRIDDTPVGIPIWFEWTDEVVLMFSYVNSVKVERLRSNPTASLVVANNIGEPEEWVAFDGTITISDSGGLDLAQRLAPRYWDLTEPRNRDELASWLRSPENFCLLTLTPERIRRK
jgi:nitroimidazol reductase NimA-like FMN-containing flavoprotein (pyridoxamine 5'-phosphate oxidase superfamily)